VRVPMKTLQQFRDIWIKIDLSLSTPRFDTILDAAMPRLLLDADCRAVRREVLVDFDPKRLSYTKAASGGDDEEHLLPQPVVFRKPAIVSDENDGRFCSVSSTMGMSMKS